VQIAEMNTIAKGHLAEQKGQSLRNRLIARPEWLGKVGGALAPLSNWGLKFPPTRWVLHWVLGIHPRAPLPAFKRQTFRTWFFRKAPTREIGRRKVVYFHGCSTNYYEPRVGQALVKLLDASGIKVSIAEQNCCGLPLQSNGDFASAREMARQNIAKLTPYVRENYVIVGSSTSCTLMFKHEYQSVLGLRDPNLELIAANTYDICEFLLELHQQGQLFAKFRPLHKKLFYHPPCQQRSHGIGQPAIELLKLIPGLQVEVSQAACCGIAGTYGVKSEKYKIARDVGEPLFAQIEESNAARVICDSETCRWWIDAHTHPSAPSLHPIEILAEQMMAR
jgi:glycerol-3-phosphate dehydrogenase subunit C